MNDELKTWFLTLTDSDKVVFLASVAHQLTINGRGFGLHLSEKEQILGFKGLNELQHQISGQIAGIELKHDRYPDDIFLTITRGESWHLWRK